jgi:hypothetical protein
MRRAKHRALVAAVVGMVSAGCGSAGSTAGAPSAPVPIPDRFTITYRADAPQTRTVVAAPVERVWDALPGVYREFGYPAAPASNTPDRVYITPALLVRGRLYQGERNSDYLDCGDDPNVGARADAHEVTFWIVTRVQPTEEGHTLVETMIDGRARDRQSSSTPAYCFGTGKLEKQIAALLLQRTRF